MTIEEELVDVKDRQARIDNLTNGLTSKEQRRRHPPRKFLVPNGRRNRRFLLPLGLALRLAVRLVLGWWYLLGRRRPIQLCFERRRHPIQVPFRP